VDPYLDTLGIGNQGVKRRAMREAVACVPHTDARKRPTRPPGPAAWVLTLAQRSKGPARARGRIHWVVFGAAALTKRPGAPKGG